jgi:hypothetical protein
MRSDRNPYYLVRKSKDPQVQAWLSEAAHMTDHQIHTLPCKPDVKKALMFAKHLQPGVRSQTTAELLADRMNSHVHPHVAHQHELWQYDGEACWIKCAARQHMQLVPPFVFLKNQNQAYVGRVWVSLLDAENYVLIQQGRQIGMADHSRYNQITHELIQKRYSK